MEWKKSNITQTELEKQQQAYIKEALEMAKRSVTAQFEKAERAENERIAAEKAEAERIAAEKAEAERIAAEKAVTERIAAEKAKTESQKLKEELTTYSNTENEPDQPETCTEPPPASSEDIIDISEFKKNAGQVRQNNRNQPPQQKPSSPPPNFNRYINDHNKSQCNCPNCQRKRAEQKH